MKQIYQLKIERMTMNGYGIGFANSKAVFVSQTLPGDVIDANVSHERKEIVFARVLRYISRGEGYLPPPCDAFTKDPACGGCDWLMADYTHQLKWKNSLLREVFEPFIAADKIADIIPSPKEKHYRNKVFMPVGKSAGGMEYGIFARFSHHIVSHNECQIHPPVFDAIAKRVTDICLNSGIDDYDELRHKGNLRHLGLRMNKDGSQILLVLVTLSAKLPFSGLLVKQLTAEFPTLCGIVQNINRERGNIILGTEEKLLWGEPSMIDELGGSRFRVHYRSFWQVNPYSADLIVNQIAGLISKRDRVIDAFSGIGAIGIPLAQHAETVVCIEENEFACMDGEFNADLSGLTNLSFIRARVEDQLPKLLADKEQGRFSTIVFDPPRGGLEASVIEAVLSAKIPRIIYLSCSPMTMARDMKLFIAKDAYRVEFIQPFDMFPQTWHIECLALLTRNK
ncbi:MAG: 23S rRNA (uracil(1939)-C(5))-methyltransferase RlmD [Candidatus Cloacimonadaceae bacterium]|nr:23S rRNA (uracil(1939)-C(5))-methyltransferase RlmD [Candidatus Cloacimonadaceae bacterium]MDP3113769.1 23S rRNA (uracil(1939)-C(5))-methyltransferase RlmD [Candidatus Cloacimonadaceae bacterium]